MSQLAALAELARLRGPDRFGGSEAGKPYPTGGGAQIYLISVPDPTSV